MRWRARTPVPLTQRGGSFMWTTRAEHAPEGSYHYALNVVPLEPRRPDSLIVQRPTMGPVGTGGSVTGTLLATGSFSKVDGTVVTWLLTTAGIWQIVAGAYTALVSAANFATASITLPSTTHYWCVFNNKVAFNPSDGTNKPWTWDGTAGAGGLVKLTNAPLAYGKPTVRSAKLFLIEWSARDTIAWSEENDATLGYATAPYTNEWKLSQTGTAPLYAIHGTNDGLYYFRQARIGVIRGDAGPDFVTASTHDAVSQSIGTISPAGVAQADDDLWFSDQFGVPHVLPAGGRPEPVLYEMRSETSVAEPFGFDDVGWARGSAIHQASVEVLAIPALGPMPYRTVWFHVTAGTPTAGRAFLVCHAESRRALAWFVPYVGVAFSSYMGLYYDATLARYYPYTIQTSNLTAFQWGDNYTGGDVNISSAAQVGTFRLIGSPLGASDLVELQFDRLSFVGSASGASETVSVQLMTSRRDAAATVSAAQTPTIGTSGSLDRITVGLNQNGRWGRPVFTITSATIGKWHMAGWTLSGYPVAIGPTVP